MLSLLPAVLLVVSRLVYAGSSNWGEPCSQSNSRLQIGTYQFWSECNSKTFCASNSTCAYKGCRKDEFPFGYDARADDVPPKCARGSFCPDEQDNCLPVQPVGSACQLNRDDQCEGPPNYRELADRSEIGLNVNGSVCINAVCMWANVTEGESCAVENVAYIAYGTNQEFIDVVSRGNCRLGLYCDSQQLRCLRDKSLAEACEADKECSSYNCLSSGRCGESPKTPRHFGAWVYVLVCLGIFGGMFAILLGLFWLHRSQRDEERDKRLQYWREQNAFHQSLTQMRETARYSIMSMGNNSARSSTYTENSVANVPPQAVKASSLRYVNDSLTGSLEPEQGRSYRD